MRLTVDAIEHQVTPIVQFVSEALGGDTTDDGTGVFSRLEHI